MPLPGKKTKVSRISRLVADFQSPPKRGGSLVVETGFPTSLVDLFVKNRDRLKKQSKKKSQSQPPLEISRPMNATPPPPCYNFDTMLILSSGCEGIEQKNEIKSNPVQESVVVEECDGDRDGGEDESKKKNVSAAVLRVFLVVVLLLSTKTLAIGITKSAFLLLMLEFGRTGLMSHLRPCSKATTVFVFLVEKVKILCFSKCKKEEIERCEEHSTKECSNDVYNSSVEEIQVVECNRVEVIHVEEITSTETDLEPVSGDARGRSSDMETKEKIKHKNEEEVDFLVCKKGQRRAKMKATFVKKLVPKKLRGKLMRGKEMESNSENRSSGEEKSARIHRAEDQQNRDKQEHDEDELYRSRKDESDHGITTQSQTESEMSLVEETRERERKGNSECLVLCLIVLVGLGRGRVVALVVTMGWCLVLKLARKLRHVTISS